MHHPSRRSPVLALALGLVASLALAGIALAAETTLTAQLSGSAETDEDGSGMATIVVDPEAGTACWEMSAENIDAVTVSHIHEGAAGVDGGVVVDLDVDGFDGSSEGCNDTADADALQAIVDNPSGYYVNLHTEAYPPGAIRGQLAAGSAPNTALPTGGSGAATLLGVLALAAAALFATRLAAVARRRR